MGDWQGKLLAGRVSSLTISNVDGLHLDIFKLNWLKKDCPGYFYTA